MKKNTLQKNIQGFIAVALLGFGLISAGNLSLETPLAEAQTCTAGDSVGNLFGYATTSNDFGRIYMSTESWNDEEPQQTNVQFAVSYNRQTGTWSGRGWNKEIGWVDFGENYPEAVASRQAIFQEIEQDQEGWGNWSPAIDLLDVSYTSDPGAFTGFGVNSAFTGAGDDIAYDDYIGVGNIDFSNVQLVESPCNEYVDVTLNNRNILYSSTCDIVDPVIRWSTTGIVNGSCIASGGVWTSIGSKSDQNLSGEEGNNITSNNAQVVRLTCIGASSGAQVYGEAYASCGGCPDGQVCTIDPTTGLVIPQFREV